jgi:hypothetical protein
VRLVSLSLKVISSRVDELPIIRFVADREPAYQLRNRGRRVKEDEWERFDRPAAQPAAILAWKTEAGAG